VASYKFALGKSLLELAAAQRDFVSLEDLAVPFSGQLVIHLKNANKQTTSRSSRFLDSCRKFNTGEIGADELREITVRRGFDNVIDAFHIVGRGEIPKRFFVDERAGRVPGIRLTDDLHRLAASYQAQNLPGEIEARWRLVETAWELEMSRNLVGVQYEPSSQELVVARDKTRRRAVTSCRSALDGYQKGKCFYCFADVSIVEGSVDLADVDHVFPHVLQVRGVRLDLDGIWNLVLACARCNRGVQGKFDSVPDDRYIERLSERNERLIGSHHPLRETLIAQSGGTVVARREFLNQVRADAVDRLVHRWSPVDEQSPCF
jgi:hypothetical protein